MEEPLPLSPASIEWRYRKALVEATDIREHIPLLKELASRCEHVTEFGVRGATGSTVAFLAGAPKKLVSWDVSPWAIVSQTIVDLVWITAQEKKTIFEPRVGSTLEVFIEPTDLLFIDTDHTYKQLRAELERHCDPKDQKVRKYIAFHDTVTFGTVGGDGSIPGLRAAIRWFQKDFAFPLWQLIEDRQNNNGLVVLRRIDVKD